VLSTLFGSKPKNEARPTAAAPSLSEDLAIARKETGMVLDALGSVLQFYGGQAFDLDLKSADDVRSQVGAWARHATMGAARPGSEEIDPASVGVLLRDWKGMVKSFGELRRQERQFVVTSHGDLRSVVSAFVGAAHLLAVEDAEDERATGTRLQRLKEAATSNDTESLKREALAAVDEINTLMRTRREKQKARLKSLADSVRSLRQELAVAKTESMLDPLTGLSNRKAFDEYLAKTVEFHAMLGAPACLMLIDIDHFKTVNDTHGHPVGDAVLRRVASAISRTFLRRSDFVTRYGGDEFAVILPETPQAGAEQLAERLRYNVMSVNTTIPELETSPTLSIGIAELVLGDDAGVWVKRSDDALYAGKGLGRDRVQVAEGAPVMATTTG
jgi:diguanylate cyclase